MVDFDPSGATFPHALNTTFNSPPQTDSGDGVALTVMRHPRPGRRAYRTRLIDEVQRLRQRLEISDAHPYDGIAARDATIRGLERDAEQLREALSRVISERDAATARLKAMTQAADALLGEAENVDGERFSATWDAYSALMGTLPNENRLALNASHKDDAELLVNMSIILSPRDEVGAVDRSTLRALCDQERDPSAAWDACVTHMKAHGLKFSDGEPP